MKNYLASLKRKYMYSVMPLSVTHWNENKKEFNFFVIDGESIVFKKPLWLRIFELYLYGGK